MEEEHQVPPRQLWKKRVRRENESSKKAPSKQEIEKIIQASR